MTERDALRGPSLQLPILQRRPETSPDAVAETSNVVDVGPLVRAVSANFEQTITRIHHGPLPDPETFGAYNLVLPGAAEQLMAMAQRSLNHQILTAERDQEHRHAIEHRQLRLAERSQWCALAVVGVVVAAGAWLVSQNQPVVGGLAMGIPLVGLVGAFLYPHLRRQPASSGSDDPADSAERAATEQARTSRQVVGGPDS